MTDNDLKQVSVFDDVARAHDVSGAGRIFTIMGPNGAGKSRLLAELNEQLKRKGVRVVHIPPKRELITVSTVITDPSHDGPDALTRMSQRTNPLPIGHAAVHALKSAYFSAHPRREQWKENIAQLVEKDRKAPLPPPPDNQVEEYTNAIKAQLGYQLFTEPVPTPGQTPPAPASRTTIIRPANQENFEMTFRKDNSIAFKGNELSDGEKQILLIMSLYVESKREGLKAVVLVDEPELYLNEARAIEFWEMMEDRFPATIWVYATHNVLFATRPRVESTYLMRKDGTIDVLSLDDPLPQWVVRDMVSARVQILRSEKPIVFCEDNFLHLIAQDMLGSEFQYVVLGGYSAVTAAANNESKSWNQIRSPHAFCGVIDRDARDDENVATMAKKNVYCFPFFEAESLLLIPDIALLLLSNRAGQSISRDTYVEAFLESAYGAREKTFASIRDQLIKFNLPTIEYDAPNDEHEVTNIKAGAKDDLVEKFRLRATEVALALRSKSMDQIPIIFDGKGMCACIAEMSHDRFKVSFGARPEEDYEYVRQLPAFGATLRRIPVLTKWAQQIRDHLIPPERRA